MSLFKRNEGSGAKLNPVLYVIAAILMPFIEGARWCTDKVYHGWIGGLRAFFGVLFGIGGAISAAHYVGWTHGFGAYAWLPAGALAWLAVYFYIFPLVYRFVVTPVWDFCEAVVDRVRKFAQKYFGNIVNGIVTGISTVCVGSSGAWTRVRTKEHEDTWFARLLGAVAHLSTFAGTAYLGYQSYLAVGALISVPVIGFILAVAAGALAFGITFGLLEQFMDYGKLSFIAVGGGIAAVWGAAPYLVASLGVSGIGTYLALAAAYVLFVGYIFPFVNVAFTNGFWAKVWKIVKPLPEKTYDDNDKPYAEFFHHLVNGLATAGLGYATWAISASVGLPLWAIVPITAFVGVLTYILGFKLLNWSGGNFITGGLVSLAAAYKVGALYVSAGYVYGIYGGIVAGVLALLVTGAVAFPLVYLGVRAVLRVLGAASLAKPLTSLYNAANEQFKKALKEIRNAYKSAYDDKSGYQDLIVHLTNIATAFAIFLGAGKLAALLGVGVITGWVFVALATALGYLLVGKLLLKTGYGLEFLGGCVGLAAAIFAGSEVFAVSPGALFKFVGVVTGFATWIGVFFIAFPVAYVVARTLTSWAFTGWLKPLLAWVYDAAWSVFVGIWGQFLRAYRGLKKALTPLFAAIGAALARVRDAYRELLRKISGR